MKEYLLIENFGPIRRAEFDDIRPLTVLIGLSGSGKSTVMKVLSLFRWVFKRINLRSYLKHSGIKRTNLKFRAAAALKTSGLQDYLRPDTKIIYRNDPYEIAMEGRVTKSNILISPEHLSLEKIVFVSDKRAIIPSLQHMVGARTRLSYHLLDTYDNFLKAIDSIPALSLDYLDVNLSRRRMSNGLTDYVITGEGANGPFDVNLRDASSGIQTSAPLGLITEYYARYYNLPETLNNSILSFLADTDQLTQFRANKDAGDFRYKDVHLLVEEPELSLYPDNQLRLIDFMLSRCMAAGRQYDMTLMMATHSPYIVNYVNLLMARSGKAEGQLAVNPDDVNVYLIEDGMLHDLKVTGTDGRKVIDTTMLSDPIARIYTEYNQIITGSAR